jgi:hypothetical protein
MRGIALLPLLPLPLLVTSATDRSCISASLYRIGFEILFFVCSFCFSSALLVPARDVSALLRARTSRNCS